MTNNEAGFTWDSCQGLLFQKAQREGWALCIGAGTSKGAFPDWYSLVESLIRKDATVTDPKALLESLYENYSLDALIEAAKNVLRMEDEPFADLLTRMLYQNFKEGCGDRWQVVSKAITAVSPGDLSRGEWRAFRMFINKKYPSLSARQLAEIIVEIAETDKAPSAILSFNGEQLMYSLIHAFQVKAHPGHRELRTLRLLDRVTKGMSNRESGRIPYIFCHGLMPIKDGLKKFPKLASPEKVVFSEGEYLQIANTSFSWQSSLFLGTAVLRSMVFVGLSFSDSNLRRWLAWVHSNRHAEWKRMQEMNLEDGKPRKDGASPPFEHYWIDCDPRCETKRRWIEAAVRHLGVRLVWIDEWSRLGAYFRRMLSPVKSE